MEPEKKSGPSLKKLYICGIIIAVVFCGYLIGSKVYRDCKDSNVTARLNENESEETIDGFYDLEDFLLYFEDALETDDVDRYLRGCAIDEKVDNYPFTYYMKMNSDLFSYNNAYLPSKKYTEYAPVNKLLITDDFLDQYEKLRSQLKELAKTDDLEIEFENVGILYEENQMESDFIKDIKQRATRWDADYFVELAASIKVDGGNYTFCFTVGRYDQCYKLFKLQANLADWDSDVYVKETTENMNAMYSSVGVSEFSGKLEESVMEEIPEKDDDAQFVLDSRAVSLPVNYSIVNQEYCGSAHKCISEFLLEIARHNPLKALNYVQTYTDADDFEDIINQQGNNALQLSYLYKGLAGLPYSSALGIKYEYIGILSGEVGKMLNPVALHTMSVTSIEDTDEPNEFIATVSYNQESYKLGFTLAQTEKGWVISSLSAKRNGITVGQVIKTEDKEKSKESSKESSK